VGIISGKEIVLAVRMTLPPETPPERAAALLSQGGVNLPLGLVQFVRTITVAVVEVGEAFTVPPVEEGGKIMRVM
jgi:hypothetical protein